jgi:hypothetical protein
LPAWRIDFPELHAASTTHAIAAATHRRYLIP